MKKYICDKCNELIDENCSFIQFSFQEEFPFERYMQRQELLDYSEQIFNLGIKIKKEFVNKLFHNKHIYLFHGGTNKLIICGPLREESEQEYFIRWCQGDI